MNGHSTETAVTRPPLRRRGAGGFYRPWYVEWEAHPRYTALPKSAQAVYRVLYCKTGSSRWVALSMRDVGLAADLGRREARRAVARLQEAGLLDVEVTRGGWHGSVNRYLARALSKAYKGEGLDVQYVDDVAGPPIYTADKPSRPGGQDVSADDEDMVAWFWDHEDNTVMQLTYATPADMLAELSIGEIRAWCKAKGFARERAPRGTTADVAVAMVEDYLGVIGAERAPLRREIAQARQVVEAAGPRAWDLYLAAMRAMVALVRSWKGRKPGVGPRTFGYLLPHLARVGAWRDPSYDEDDDRPPPG